ncbi:hypothetical protein E2I00_018983, partial [Balaenoptera physalus]
VNGPAGLHKALGTVCLSPRTQAYLADGDPLQSHTHCRQWLSVLSLHHAPMGHSCRPGQAWDVCKQQGGEVASRALSQVQVVQAKREEQGRHCHLEHGVGGRPPPGRDMGRGAPHTLPLLWGLLFRLVRWMMYWIVFALFMAVETFTDIFISWFPFYYEIKMAFVLWLLSPYTKGASLLYRKFVHPSLSRHEKVPQGEPCPPPSGGAADPTLLQSQGALAGRLRSFSMQDLRTISDAPAPTYQDPLYLEDQVSHRRPPIGYRAGGLQDSDTEDECWSDTEVVPQPSARPREKPLGRTQSLRHLALPEGSDEEEDHAFRHGQLGSAEPGPVLPRALQGVGTVWRGPLAARLACLHQLPACCPPDSCCRLRATCGAAPMMHQSRLGSGFYLLSSSPLYLP